MKVVVTGGTGFIGARVVAALAAKGHQIALLDVAPNLDRFHGLVDRFGTERITLHTADVLDVDGLDRILGERSVDVIVHLAYMLGTASKLHIRRSTEVNLVGTANVLEAARRLGIPRVVCASSLSVFGSDADYAADQLPLGDDAPQVIAKDLRLYGASKVYLEAMAEAYREAEGPLTVGLRPGVVYGGAPANGSIDWIYSSVASAAARKPTAIANGNACLSMIHVDDIADQFVALAEAPADAFGPTFFLNSGGDTCTISEFGDALRRAFPEASIDVEMTGPSHVMGLASEFSGDAIDSLVGHPRRLCPIDAGIRQYADDIATGRVHS